jgi:hypothetical protein
MLPIYFKFRPVILKREYVKSCILIRVIMHYSLFLNAHGAESHGKVQRFDFKGNAYPSFSNAASSGSILRCGDRNIL